MPSALTAKSVPGVRNAGGEGHLGGQMKHGVGVACQYGLHRVGVADVGPVNR